MTGAHRSLEDQVTAAEVKVSKFARAVALRRAVIVSGVTGLLMLGVMTGWITPGLSDHVRAGVDAGLGWAGIVGAGAWIHRGATPAKQQLQPRNAAGQRLLPDQGLVEALGLTDAPADPDAMLQALGLNQAGVDRSCGRATAMTSPPSS